VWAELRALLKIFGVIFLYGAGIFAGWLGFGAGMSDGEADPITGAPTKPWEAMLGFYALAFLLFLIAGVLWIWPILRSMARGSGAPRRIGFGAMLIGAVICFATIWAFRNIAHFSPETSRALTLPLLLGIAVGPSLLLAGGCRLIRPLA
jgi:hypothetical protein